MEIRHRKPVEPEHFGLLIGVLGEYLDLYEVQYRHFGQAEARKALLAATEEMVQEQPDIAARLLAAAVDQLVTPRLSGNALTCEKATFPTGGRVNPS